MAVEVATHVMQCEASQHDLQITHTIILTDSTNLLQKVESRNGCPDWHTAMHKSYSATNIVNLLPWACRS